MFKVSKAKKSYQNMRPSSQILDASSTELMLPKLNVNQYPIWRRKTLHILQVHHLSHTIDTGYARVQPLNLPPCGPTFKEIETRNSLATSHQKRLDRDNKEHTIVYVALYNSLPDTSRDNWTRDIIEPSVLWTKAGTMCNFREDHHLKSFYKEAYDAIKCNSGRLLDIVEYENALVKAIFDHEEAGGYITMEDKVEKIKKEMRKYIEIYNDMITFMMIDGPEIVNYPATAGWTVELIFDRIRRRLEIAEVPEFLKKARGGDSHRDRSNKNEGSAFQAKKSYFSPRGDFSQREKGNRGAIRENIRSGAYHNRDNRKGYNPKIRRVKSNPNRSSSTYFKSKRSLNNKNYSRNSGRNVTNSIESNTNAADDSRPKYDSQTKANYDVKGNNNKFVNKNKQSKFGATKKVTFQGVGKKVGNYKNFGNGGGAGSKRPYTDPYCDICSTKGHYHFQCNNHSKNKNAHPRDGKTMSCLTLRGDDKGIHWNDGKPCLEDYRVLVSRHINPKYYALRSILPLKDFRKDVIEFLAERGSLTVEEDVIADSSDTDSSFEDDNSMLELLNNSDTDSDIDTDGEIHFKVFIDQSYVPKRSTRFPRETQNPLVIRNCFYVRKPVMDYLPISSWQAEQLEYKKFCHHESLLKINFDQLVDKQAEVYTFGSFVDPIDYQNEIVNMMHKDLFINMIQEEEVRENVDDNIEDIDYNIEDIDCLGNLEDSNIVGHSAIDLPLGIHLTECFQSLSQADFYKHNHIRMVRDLLIIQRIMRGNQECRNTFDNRLAEALQTLESTLDYVDNPMHIKVDTRRHFEYAYQRLWERNNVSAPIEIDSEDEKESTTVPDYIEEINPSKYCYQSEDSDN